MKIVSNRFVPFPGFKAVNLLGVMFVRRGFRVTEVDIRHEQIHTRQMLELGVLPFYVLYVAEWLLCACRCVAMPIVASRLSVRLTPMSMMPTTSVAATTMRGYIILKTRKNNNNDSRY